MEKIYSSPLRVYIALAFLACVGIWSGFSLPISLFPAASRPQFFISLPYGSFSSKEFLNSYGMGIESSLRSINKRNMKTDQLEAFYNKNNVEYEISFEWGSDGDEAEQEVRSIITSTLAPLPQENREFQIFNKNEGGGFLAISFFSEQMSTAQLYAYLRNIFDPPLAKIKDARWAGVWSPERKEIQVQLKPQVMALNGLLPRHVEMAIVQALQSYNAGSLEISGKNYYILLNKAATALEDVANIPISNKSGRPLKLSDVADVSLRVPIDGLRMFKTNGSGSIIVFGDPKPGGNIKKMSEDIIKIVEDQRAFLPDHIQYKILVDPSEFIRSAIKNVLKEVFLAAFLAVFVLFFFIGSFKNVITAAVEIPLSIILAFILMKFFKMNINLISLGGLALSAGMNVDASVVVMENIFRYFEKVKGSLSYQEKLSLVVKAVNEVKIPIIASTIASIVVFLPLIYTRGLSEAILGDLAKAVVFSHGLSAIVALVLVPTVRLQMMKHGGFHEKPSLIDPFFSRLEVWYEKALSLFLDRKKFQVILLAVILILTATIVFFISPRLKRELIGKPDSDYLLVSINKQGNSNSRQMESQSDEVESLLLKELGDDVRYSFVMVNGPQQTTQLFRLINRKKGDDLVKKTESLLKDDPSTQYYVGVWNPSEFRLPDPPDLELNLQAEKTEALNQFTSLLRDKIQDTQLYPRMQAKPSSDNKDIISLTPKFQMWPEIFRGGADLQIRDLADISRVATSGKVIQRFPHDKDLLSVKMIFPDSYVRNIEDLGALPIGIDNRIVPLKALAEVVLKREDLNIFRMNESEMSVITGRFDKKDGGDSKTAEARIRQLVDEAKKELGDKNQVSVQFLDAKREVNDSLNSLNTALILSAVLILLTMVFQIGSLANSLLVMVAVPFGIIGVFLSLFIFQSTLSLNSFLGMILLNGIAVANSIILVDFLNRLHESGLQPKQAALQAGRTRLRPIIMTTLTTVLGMIPIALGSGEGGKILQPLGISVAGGLWVSTLLTLFVVPTLQVYYLEWRGRRS